MHSKGDEICLLTTGFWDSSAEKKIWVSIPSHSESGYMETDSEIPSPLGGKGAEARSKVHQKAWEEQRLVGKYHENLGDFAVLWQEGLSVSSPSHFGEVTCAKLEDY